MQPLSLPAILFIAAGGAAGTLARYALVELAKALHPPAPGTSGPSFPWGTLAVNLLGCFAIGLLATLIPETRPQLRAAVLVGVLGGFTTFSSFAWETHQLWPARPLAATLYVLTSILAGLALAHLGSRVA